MLKQAGTLVKCLAHHSGPITLRDVASTCALFRAQRVHCFSCFPGAQEEDNVTETSIGIEVGLDMPVFELPDQEGQPFILADKLEEGPIVLIFYRGDW